VVRVGHDGTDIVEHGAKDLLKMVGPFLEVSGVGDVKDAMRLRPRQAFDQADVCLLDGGECWGGASAWRAAYNDVGIGAAYDATAIYLRFCAQ
jgi:hypothetical protein